MRGRPAEVTGATGAVALLLAAVLGVESETVIVALGVAAGLLPGLVTLLVAHGGVRGVLRLVWRGAEREPARLEGGARRR